MDSESEQVRDVYAYYGLAVYWASCLEQSIFQHLLFFDLFPRSLAIYKSPDKWANEFDAYEAREMAQTMGKLIRRLKEAGQPTKEIEAELEKCLSARNWLIHDYFPDRAIQFTLSDGRAEMITELESFRDMFRHCANGIDALTQPALEKYGISEEGQKKIKEELVNEYRSGVKSA